MLLFTCLFTIIVAVCLVAAVKREFIFAKRANSYSEFHSVKCKDDEMFLGKNAIKYSDIVDIIVLRDQGGAKYQEEYFLGYPGKYNYTIVLRLKNNIEKYLRAYDRDSIRYFFRKLKKKRGITAFPSTDLDKWLSFSPTIALVLIIILVLLFLTRVIELGF